MANTVIRLAVGGALAVALLGAPIVAAAADATKPENKPSQGALLPETYRIGPEDVLQISVWKNDGLTRTVPVRPDGKISLPLLNDVLVAGLTPLELQAQLVTRFSEFIPMPEVTVIVTEIHSVKFSVMGEVLRPGRYEARSQVTVPEALALAGGFTMFASRKEIIILRPEGRSIKSLKFNMKKLLGDGSLSSSDDESVYVRPGDTLIVP